ncbi:MAG: hypothetical protein WD646_04765 [Actinomycetota bacterium]
MATVFDDLDRETLATLVREYLLCGHLIDRSGMAHVLAAGGIDAMREIAIEEWMGASPIYTRRIRRALGIEGDDVGAIFKAMQIDIGAPPQFMDFRYKVIDSKHGEFVLASCGALRDVEPMGEEYVVTMCHHIEDPTFDATAAATNPRARMRPIHRPPRTPADRLPHCHWTVEIADDADPVPEPEPARCIAKSRAADIGVVAPSGADDEGRARYDGPLAPDLRFEEFSRHTLITTLQEVALQWHLLALSFALAVEQRFGKDVASQILVKQFTGIAGLSASRIGKALGLGSTVGDIAAMLELHPAFHPRSYVDVKIVHDPMEVHLRDCEAIGDSPGRSWADVLADGNAQPLDAMVHAVHPGARCVAIEPAPGDRRAWSVTVVADEEARESREVAVTRISTGSEFAFEER